MKNQRTWPYQGKLIIFTTFYESRGYAPYIKSLATTISVLERLGIKYDYWQRAGDFHVERAINDTMTKFLQTEDATDFLMIDADEEWSAEHVVRLLMHPEDIVGATYRMKHRWNDYVGSINRDPETGMIIGRELPDGTNLISASRLSGGFIRFKKAALQRYHDFYPDMRCIEPDGEMTIFYERAKIDGVMHSQDMAFSRKLVEMGEELWVDPHIKVNHYGLTCYEGDYDAYLKGKKLLADAEPAFKVVQEMAEKIKERKTA